MLATMPKPERKRRKPSDPVPHYPSRDNYTSVTLAKAIADELRAIADAQDRSVSYIVRKACEAYIAASRKPRPE
jgi:hypothetical protein